MSVLFNSMDMPKSCAECQYAEYYGEECNRKCQILGSYVDIIDDNGETVLDDNCPFNNFWNKYSKDCKPKKNGLYFIVKEYSNTYFPRTAYFSNNLKKDVDVYYKKVSKYGFYYSDSEYGDIIIDNENVILWAKIPDYERMIK